MKLKRDERGRWIAGKSKTRKKIKTALVLGAILTIGILVWKVIYVYPSVDTVSRNLVDEVILKIIRDKPTIAWWQNLFVQNPDIARVYPLTAAYVHEEYIKGTIDLTNYKPPMRTADVYYSKIQEKRHHERQRPLHAPRRVHHPRAPLFDVGRGLKDPAAEYDYETRGK